MLTWTEIETRAIAFQNAWKKTDGDERQDAQTFEKDLMNVFGVDFRDGLHEYQLVLNDGSLGYIDYFLPKKILIEMKSKGKSLAKAYSQAMDYVHALKPDEKPELVMVSDFDKIQVYNLEKNIPYKPFKVSQLKNHIRIFGVVAGYKDKFEERNEIELNTTASYKMAKLHDLLKEYGYEEHSLEIYLVRLLFCLFADDTGIFEKDSFEDYVKSSNEDGSDLAMRMMILFNVLDTPLEKRMKNLSPELNRFRYINGNLFTETLPPAIFDGKMRELLIECCDFDWSKISPAIFGAMFQGVIDPKQRRELGIHYTSEENIMKVIKPLFLDELYKEFEQSKATRKELEDFHNKIAGLKFLDPACGSGNFLILTYQKLRELEFEILKFLENTRQLTLFDINSKVHINQFYGIEYEPFASEIAKISILLMKHLMDRKVSNHFGQNLIDFPIKENANIINDNALRIEWENVDYILGNPPFVGKKFQTKPQQEDMEYVFKKFLKSYKSLDYVTAWFWRASELIKTNHKTKVCLVSTNSIVQGENVPLLWENIFQKNIEINIGYPTFQWTNKAKGKAGVHCVIVGMAYKGTSKKLLFDGEKLKEVENINGYLKNAENIFIKGQSKPLFKETPLAKTGTRIGNTHYIFTEEEKEKLVTKYPILKLNFHEFLGGYEFLNNEKRYCLYLKGLSLSALSKIPEVMEIVNQVSKELKDKGEEMSSPYEYKKLSIPKEKYIFIPQISSENRNYIPLGYIEPEVWVADPHFMIEGASLSLFSILTSSVHMAWLRTVAGRLKSDYRYSNKIVYNTFPFPKMTDKLEEKLRKTAENIIKAREIYSLDSLATLYNLTLMPTELRKAHQENDKAVWEAYGKKWELGNEEQCVAYLMKLYKELTEK